jgi:hypothetical protein
VGRRRLLAAVAVAVAVTAAVLLAGCGDGDEESAKGEPASETSVSTVPADEETEPADGANPLDDTSAGGVDACAIVDTLDVEALLGEAPAPRADETSELGAVCVVEPADPESRAAMRLVVEAERGPENYAQQKDLLGVDSEPAGFGDEAFHTGPYLFVLKGETLAFIQVVRDGSKGVAVEDAQLEAAMTTVLEALEA